jgi:aspartyl-tRNA(Asn)/glutamyl-tRNA(Gln) amidotransferase subunit A
MIYKNTLANLSKGLSEKQFSSQELTQYYLTRMATLDPELNSFITITAEQALATAKRADDLRAQNLAGPLTGIPMAHKDIFCTADVRTSCGAKMLDNFIAPYDATAVAKLKQAGMVMLGKTNMDEFAMGSSNETSYYGPCKNPWNLDCVPGGSSGGSAAAVAARLVPMATATDTGGSIRQPAALCGISGLKPTYGRVSRWGMIAFASSLDQGGIMAQTAEDIALVLNQMAGFDEKDSTSVDCAVPDYTADLNNPLQGLKIGLPKEYFDGLDHDMAAIIDTATKQLEKLGASLHEVHLPNVKSSVPVYYVLAPAECSANLSRFDGVRYGYRCDDPKNLLDLYQRTRAEAFGAEVKRRILIGTYVLSAGHYDAYYLQAQRVRQLITNDFNNVFQQVDVILSPTSPNVAFKFGEKAQDPVSMYLSDIYTIAANLTGLPGLSIPAGMLNQLPVGLQLIGKHFAESTLLNVAHQYQKATDWHEQIPLMAQNLSS